MSTKKSKTTGYDLDALGEEYGVSRTTIFNRLRDGWVPGEPLPVHPHAPHLRKRIKTPEADRDAGEINQVLRRWKRT